MKTITFPVGYRPGYLKQFLSFLAHQESLSDYKIICSAEKCPPCIEVLETCGLPITILHKPNSTGVRSHGGARDNMFNVLNYAFANGSTFNVHLEDDFVLSPDALNLTDWYYNTYKNDPLKFMSYGLFNWGSTGSDYQGLVTAPSFHGLGWATFKEGCVMVNIGMMMVLLVNMLMLMGGIGQFRQLSLSLNIRVYYLLFLEHFMLVDYMGLVVLLIFMIKHIQN